MVEEGWSISDVEAFCNKYGLVLEKVEQETAAYTAGTVIGQSRTKGSTIIKGTTLKIISTGKSPESTHTPKKRPSKVANLHKKRLSKVFF